MDKQRSIKYVTFKETGNTIITRKDVNRIAQEIIAEKVTDIKDNIQSFYDNNDKL